LPEKLADAWPQSQRLTLQNHRQCDFVDADAELFDARGKPVAGVILRYPDFQNQRTGIC